MRCSKYGAEVFKKREEKEEKMVNHYKTIINNLIDIYCDTIYVGNWGTNGWIDFLQSIGFSAEDIDDFLENGNLS